MLNLWGWRSRGDAARDRLDWPSAIDFYGRHLARYPADAAIWVQFGHVNKEDGQLVQALAAYERAARLLPDDADLLLNMGHLLKKMGRLRPALIAYERSSRLDPGLHAGAAMIQTELLLARFAWRVLESGWIHLPPADMAALLAVVGESQARGRGVFASYFRSFESR